MKISVSSYSFSQHINDGTMTQLDTIKKAKELGFDSIEFATVIPHDGSTPEGYAAKLAVEAKALDFPITGYLIGADFINGSDGNLDAEVERVKQHIDIAAILGAPLVRHDATQGFMPGTRGHKGFDQVLPILAEGCRRVTEYAATKGIRTTVENHGYFCQDSDRVEKLVNAVAHENFGLLVDMGNFLCADENPITAVSRVAPYAFHAHAKDFHVKSPLGPNPGDGFFPTRSGTFLRGAIIGHGDVPVQHCIKTLKMAGYDGYIAIEFEGIEECVMALSIGQKNLRRYIESV